MGKPSEEMTQKAREYFRLSDGLWLGPAATDAVNSLALLLESVRAEQRERDAKIADEGKTASLKSHDERWREHYRVVDAIRESRP